MSEFEGIRIEKVDPIVTEGGNTYELFKGLPGLQLTVCEREDRTLMGSHYHKGEDPAKDPELTYVVSGRVRIHATNLEAAEFDREVGPGHVIEIDKGVFHMFEAIGDVVLLEYRSTVFDSEKSDAYSAESYADYRNSQKFKKGL